MELLQREWERARCHHQSSHALASSTTSSNVIGIVLRGGLRSTCVCLSKRLCDLRVADRKFLRTKLLKCGANIFGGLASGDMKPSVHVLEPGKSGIWNLVALRAAAPRAKKNLCASDVHDGVARHGNQYQP